jgi:hypothetical protein
VQYLLYELLTGTMIDPLCPTRGAVDTSKETRLISLLNAVLATSMGIKPPSYKH